ncbi:HAD family hydrolase [Nakamurella leprariae]|uniref:HAD family phosphatase n=1 Tax=Nakamurella leprariae TaxID=2803911 RepID=A0A938YGD9_9ACTN|nr:HAD family hydrolase [Nakamurella leprariae]MBM9467887.1 HAD family phosphatase [Nakamurella leprariae]
MSPILSDRAVLSFDAFTTAFAATSSIAIDKDVDSSASHRTGRAAAPRLIVTDLDGTLLDEHGQVSARNAGALRRAAAAGARVVIATGRPVWWLGPVLDAGFTGTAVCLNGAVVYDAGADDIVATSPLTPSAMRRFVSALEDRVDFTVAVERFGTDESCCWAEYDYAHPWGEARFARGSRDQVLDQPAAKLLIRAGQGSASLATAARAMADDQVHVTYSTDDGLLEVAAAGVDKGATLDRLAREWGVTPAEAVAFGDMPNDLEMLTWAGRGVAMGNGHPDVVAVADEVAPEHHRDGVAVVLERWF